MNKNFCETVIDEATKLANSIKQRRLVILEDTVNHYTLKNRAKDGNHLFGFLCVYSPVEGISEGCAIGRMIADKDVCRKMDEIKACIDEKILREFIPQEVLELGITFLADLQQLHDKQIYWQNTGLTKEGVEWVEKLKIEYCE